MRSTVPHAPRLLLVALAATVAGLAALVSPTAHAAQAISSYVVDASIDASGTLQVAATITFDEAPQVLQVVIPTTRSAGDHEQYRFTVSQVTATSGGNDLGATLTGGADSATVSVPTAGLSEPVELSYAVAGAAVRAADGSTDVTWDLVGGLQLPVTTVDATLSAPAAFTMIDCAAGAPSAPGACTYYAGGTHDYPDPTFHHEGLAAGDVVRATARFPGGMIAVNENVEQVWSLDRAFSAGPGQLAAALGLLLLGGVGLWYWHRRVGRDADAAVEPTLVAEFHPVAAGQSEFRVLGGVRPGQIGTLLDERVDPVDITATLLDLAVRGHLLIEELPSSNTHALTDWTFTRLQGGDELAPYESTLLEAVAPAGGTAVLVSGLAPAVASAVPVVQSQLYDEMVTRGWFLRRPDHTRNTWARIGWIALGVAVVATVLLAAFTTFGLVGLALIILALGVLGIAAEMPARTTSGSSVLAGLMVLRGSLLTEPTDRLPAGREHAELSRILPYAVVLGGQQRWLAAIADRDDDDEADSTDLPWYHAPGDWHLRHLPASVLNFVTTVQGTLFSR